MSDPRPRPTVRLLLISPAGRLLLMRFEDPDNAGGGWCTIGGGVDDGETLEEAAWRELREETGLTEMVLGPKVWVRSGADRRGRTAAAHGALFPRPGPA